MHKLELFSYLCPDCQGAMGFTKCDFRILLLLFQSKNLGSLIVHDKKNNIQAGNIQATVA